jgi:hypothetical protein
MTKNESPSAAGAPESSGETGNKHNGKLAQHHADMLAASGITAGHAAKRGYMTCGPSQHSLLSGSVKIVKPGIRFPGLLIPLLRVDGSTWGYQYRPDEPRLRDGKPVKYETPYQQRNGLDVPPGVGPLLADPAIPLWITEGTKKADSGALQGLCIVALTGVWNWMCSSTAGGKMALPEWRDCALNGRRVIMAFDGDVARKPSVQKALHALANYLATKGARIEYLHLPDTDEKTGLDDYLAEHTVEELWRLVQPVQPVPKPEMPGDTGKPKPKPVSEPIDGAELLDDIHDFIQRFVVYPSDYNLVAHTLWIAHAWLMDCWDSTPRIAFLSPEPGSGKSRALEVTEPLVPRPVHAVNTTSAYLFRKVADPDGKPTILYDEIDTVFGPKAKENEDIRGMLNAGHRKGAVAGRCVVKGKVIETEELDAYCAVMIAGLDDLPDTIMSRSIVIRMKRRAPTEPVEPWRPRINAPEAEKLAGRLAQWAASVKEAATDLWPEMPEGVEDRHADRWEALLSIADLAGGHWPETSRVAAVTDVTDSKAATPSLGVLLLRDIKAVFDKHGADRVSTESLLTDLKGIEESPWAVIRRGEPLDARGLAQRLRKYDIKPDLQRTDDQVSRGYTRAQFADTWSRYLPDEPSHNRANDLDFRGSTCVNNENVGENVGVAAYGTVTSVTSATPQVNAQPADGYGRPPMCPGCGMFFITNGHHRDDCTASREVA